MQLKVLIIVYTLILYNEFNCKSIKTQFCYADCVIVFDRPNVYSRFLREVWSEEIDDTVKVASREKCDKCDKYDIPNLM